MSRHLAFHPFPLFSNHHAQTVVGSRLRLVSEPPSVTRIVPLPDGDKLALEVSTPSDWQPQQLTVVMVHGLNSSHRATVLIRMAQQLWQRGIRAVRMNMRGCGFGIGLAKHMAHSGRSEDILSVLEALHHETPATSFAVIGISLGGNQILKLAGELGKSAPTFLKQVIAVCPPADLSACAKLLAQPRNRFYDQHFVNELKRSVLERHRLFPELGPVSLPENLSLYQFDNCYTAPQNSFCDAADYYAKCSAAPLVPNINIPCQILFARDDPFIDGTIFANTPLPSNVEVQHTAKGGHVGFLGSPFYKEGLHWLDEQLLSWLRL